MFDVILTLLLLASVVALVALGIRKAFSQIAAHVQENPEAGKAIYEHVFMPLFRSAKRPGGADQQAKPD